MSDATKRYARWTNPKPGIYEDVPFDVYERWKPINNSSLRSACISALHWHSAQDRPAMPASDAMKIGTVVHHIVLRPCDDETCYAVVPDFEKSLRFVYDRPSASSEYKGLKADWERSHQNLIWLNDEDASRCLMAADSVVEALIDQGINALDRGKREVVVVSRCRETGLKLKAMVDLLDENAIYDIKTTRFIGEFQRDFEQFEYWRQAAFYQDVVASVTGETLPVFLIAVETYPPHCARVLRVDDRAISDGRQRYLAALRRIRKAMDTNEWPGPTDPPIVRRGRDANAALIRVDGHIHEIWRG